MPIDEFESARSVAGYLASRFPKAHFRSGNATGSYEAFSTGTVAVDPARLQVIAPYRTHRLRARFSGAAYEYPDTLSAGQMKEMIDKTITASPKAASLMKLLGKKGPLAAKADYLLRDTMKVIGFSDAFPKTTAALFFVDPADPMAGGTGHTIRVCQHEGIPVAFQHEWKQWIQ